MYPAGSPPKADNWTIGHVPESSRSLPEGRVSHSASDLAKPRIFVDTAGAIFQSFGAELVNAKGDLTIKTDEVRQALEFYKKLIPLPPAGRGRMGRRLEQQMANRRQGRDDHESAKCLGGRQARCAGNRGALLDPRLPCRDRRAASRRSCPFPRSLEFLQEQGSGEKPAAAFVAAGIDRAAGGSKRWLRPAGVTKSSRR